MIIGISGKKQSGKNTVALIWQYLYDYYYKNYKHPITVKDFKEYVKNNHHLKSVWIQKSFAHKIKQITCILLGCTMEQLEDPKFKESTLGEEWNKYAFYREKTRKPLRIYSDLKNAEEDLKIFNGGNIKEIPMTPRLLLQLLGTECGRDIIHPNIWVNATFADYQPIAGTMDIRKSRETFPNWIISDVRFFNETQAIKDRGGILIRVDRDSDSKDSHVSENELNTYKDWNYVIDNNYSLLELILKVRQIMFKAGIIYE